MRPLLVALALVPLASLAPLASGCSSNTTTDTSACKVYETPAGFDATTPAVSFKTDVVPIFQGSCAFSSCHGNEGGGNQAALYLGADSGKIFTNLVGVDATKYSMKRVTASDAKNSYLQHKIDGDTCTLAGCSGDCANTMPDDSPVQDAQLLPVDKRDVVRRWILQGAQNN